MGTDAADQSLLRILSSGLCDEAPRVEGYVGSAFVSTLAGGAGCCAPRVLELSSLDNLSKKVLVHIGFLGHSLRLGESSCESTSNEGVQQGSMGTGFD